MAGDYIVSHSGGNSPICNDFYLSGGNGLLTSWLRFQIPGAPTKVKLHLRDKRRSTEDAANMPTFRAMVGTTSKNVEASGGLATDVLLPDGGVANWKPVTWAGADHVTNIVSNEHYAIASQWNHAGEAVSDEITVTPHLQADGSSYFVICVEQNSATGHYCTFNGLYPNSTQTGPYMDKLNSLAWTDEQAYWDDYVCISAAGIKGVTDVTAHNLPPALSGNGKKIPANAIGTGIAIWIEPIYTEEIRSFLSTGDSTHSSAYGLHRYDGWIGRAVRSFRYKNNGTITYQHAGGSNHSLFEFMNIFEDVNKSSDYSDLIIHGWSQNGDWQGNPAYDDQMKAIITSTIAAAKAKKQRVFLTTGYGVGGYTTANVRRAAYITWLKSLAEVGKVWVIDTDALITDYSTTPFGQAGPQPIKHEYLIKNAEDDTMPGPSTAMPEGGDGFHCNQAGQRVLIKALQDVIATTFASAPPVDAPTSVSLSGSHVAGTSPNQTMTFPGVAGNIVHLSAHVLPLTADQTVTYSITSGDSVTVAQDGTITFVKEGVTVIKVTSSVATVFDTITVTTTAPVVVPPSGDGVIEDLTVYNRSNKTAEAQKFWASKHVCNHTKAIIAFAFNLKNANDSLRRYGYTRGWRTKALYHYGKYVNKPDMAGIPFTEMTTPWYDEMHFVAGVTIDSVLAGNIA